MNKKAFTLLELLVVVLIIGILAGIALPQYQMAVGKAKFSTLKNLTRSVWESAQRYYMVNNSYPKATASLDIDLDIKTETYKSSAEYLNFTTNDNINCNIWNKNKNNFAACSKNIFGKNIWFYVKEDGSPKHCLIVSQDINDTANKLCKKETGRNTYSSFGDGYIYYNY